MSNHRIVVLAKPFAFRSDGPGLGPILGADRAADVARALLLDIVGDLQARGFRPVVAWEGDGPPPEGLPGVECWPSGVGDLGQRLERILARATADGSIAIVIGADAPGMPSDVLDGALRRLQGPRRSHDAVVGPSHDGEFHLLGLRSFTPGLLDGVSWDAPDTCASLVRRLREAGLRTALLDPWSSVEEPSGLDGLVGFVQRGIIRAPHTSEALGFSGGF